MRRVLILMSLASAFALAAFAGPAAADPPSTNSAVNDYQESLPGAGGQGSGNGSGGGSGDATQGGSGGSQGGSGASSGAGASAGTPLSPQTADELADQGASGQGLAGAPERTGPGTASGQSADGAGAGAGASGATASSADSDSGGFFGALGDAVKSFVGGDSGSGSDSGGGGMGAAFPVLLAGGLLGAGALLFTRRKRL